MTTFFASCHIYFCVYPYILVMNDDINCNIANDSVLLINVLLLDAPFLLHIVYGIFLNDDIIQVSMSVKQHPAQLLLKT